MVVVMSVQYLLIAFLIVVLVGCSVYDTGLLFINLLASIGTILWVILTWTSAERWHQAGLSDDIPWRVAKSLAVVGLIIVIRLRPGNGIVGWHRLAAGAIMILHIILTMLIVSALLKRTEDSKQVAQKRIE